jgi:ABC-type multidrug transport system ATPase subunit
MKREGHTVVLTTHYIDEAEALCDRVAIIDHGRIIATGSPRELVAASRATLTVTATPRGLDPSAAGFPTCRFCATRPRRFRSAHANRARG